MESNNKHRDIIFRKMFQMVSLEYNPKILEHDGWWNMAEWEDGEYLLFSDWMIEYLRDSREAREEMMVVPVKNTDILRRVVSEFLSRNGWRIKKTKRREAERR